MFNRLSRYYRTPQRTAVDELGRPVQSIELRPIPETTGAFLHRLAENERLDHLASKYYTQPRFWWRLCDANPDILSPLALIGRGPDAVHRFRVDGAGALPPWSTALDALRAVLGVEDVTLVEETTLVTEIVTVLGAPVEITVDRVSPVLVVSYNRLAVSPAALEDALLAAGFPVEERTEVSRVGQPIVVPPAGPPR